MILRAAEATRRAVLDEGSVMSHDKAMKTATLDQLRTDNELLKHGEPIVLKDGERTLGLLQPFPDPDESIPLEKRREHFLKLGRSLRERLVARGITEEQIDRDIASLFDNRH